MKTKLMILFIIVLAGCSTAPDKISAAYVSPSKYMALSCWQINNEIAATRNRTDKMYANLRADRDKDNVAMTVGLILFWPALLLVDGNSPDAQTYAQLKGESEALSSAYTYKNC